MKSTRSASPRRHTARAATALLTLGLFTIPTMAFAAEEEDPNLTQTLDDLAIVHGAKTLESGHIDMGPKFDDDGNWRFLIHDDAAKADVNATSVWRYPEETVFHVLDAAMLTVPDDPAYEFLGAEPGRDVYVVPQTQNPDVVWIGWNTQDPVVMTNIDRGITLTLDSVQGPGIMTTYLQSGSFGEPQLLWDSRAADAQPVWVDVNTHTHANWVFTEPGVYLVELTAEADLIDGAHVSDTQHIRFAVGSATDPETALAAAVAESAPMASAAPESSTPAEETVTEPSEQQNALVIVLMSAIALVAVGLVAGFTIAIVRSNRARRRILADRQSVPDDGQAGEEEAR